MFGQKNYRISIELEYPVKALSNESAYILSGIICNGIVMNQRTIANVKIYKDYIDFGPSANGKDGQVFFHYHIVSGRLIYKLEFYRLSWNGVLDYTMGPVNEPDDRTVYQLLRQYVR